MTDEPRFEPVRGEPEVAHEAYYGGGLVSLVFRLVDRWRGRRQGEAKAPAAAHADGGIEIHERPTLLAPAAAVLPGAAEAAAERALYQVSPDENFSGNFLIGSARTMKVQAGLLAAFVGVMIVLVAQGVPQPERPFDQTAERRAVPSDGRALVARP
jgi:hypothetical protein